MKKKRTIRLGALVELDGKPGEVVNYTRSASGRPMVMVKCEDGAPAHRVTEDVLKVVRP